MKISVIGAGIAGMTTAYYLAKAGHKVSVFEQEPYPAMQSSYANGGQVSVSNSEVWNTYGNLLKGIKWIFTKDAPLLIRPKFSIHKINWLLKFVYHTIKNEYEVNTAKTIHMGLESRKLYESLIEEEKINFNRSKSGILHIYKSKKYFDLAKQAEKLYTENGCEWEILSKDQVIEKDFNLQKFNSIVGGVWTPSDFTGDIHEFCINLKDILQNKYNVEFIFNKFVYEDYINLMLENFECDAIVISSGIGSIQLSKYIGDNLPIYPVKGYSITIPAQDIKSFESMPKVSILDDESKIVCSLLGDKLRVAGTAEFDDINYDIRKDRIDPLLKWVRNNFPDVNTSNYSSWACLRPMTPNMLPITKQSAFNKKIFYNTGHGHLGWTLAPYTAKLISEQI